MPVDPAGLAIGRRSILGAALAFLATSRGLAQLASRPVEQQNVDPDFQAVVPNPRFAQRRPRPRLVIDAAHRNFHTADGQYVAFAGLMRADGWIVESGSRGFDRSWLRQVDLLVIANAGSVNGSEQTAPAFSNLEILELERWVGSGGSLLLVADHAPFGRLAAPIATAFGFQMGNGWVYRPSGDANGLTTQIDYNGNVGRLGRHPIISGRRADERLSHVRSFTGQSLTLPRGAAPLLLIPEGAREAADRASLDAAANALRDGRSSADPLRPGRVQAFAKQHGQGRIVVLGEAGMLSAQLVRLSNPDGTTRELRVGMNYPGVDNRQFALNLTRWLGRAL